MQGQQLSLREGAIWDVNICGATQRKQAEARHRHERQKKWHTQKYQQTSHAATKQPSNDTKTCTPAI